MEFVKNVKHLSRYKDMVQLLVKYGGTDLVAKIGVEETNGNTATATAVDVQPAELPRDLEALGPTYVKLGQFLSTRSDLLPVQYCDTLSRLQDRVEPLSYEEIEEVVISELGQRPARLFRTFEATPIASASLAQVHAAVLHDGRRVAVKVQRPDIRQCIVQDLDAFEDVAGFLEASTSTGQRLMLSANLEEFRVAMLRELDFRQEAENLETFRKNLEEFERLVVPRPIPELTTSRVLTMEFVPCRNVESLEPETLARHDGGVLAEELFRAFLKQILVDGFFHADPHPGNVALTDDGRLALLDLGMVARVPSQMRDRLFRLLVAISEGNGSEAADYALELGTRTDEADLPGFRREVERLVSEHQQRSLEQLEIGRLALEVTAISVDHGVRMPNELVMLGRTLLCLDRVGRILDPRFQPHVVMQIYAPQLFQRILKTGMSLGSLYETLLDTKEFVQKLPSRANRVLDALAHDRLTVRAEVFDEQYIVSGLRSIANRVTLGLMLSALIVGSALLMRVETSFEILGYPGIAIIFFLIAALGGVLLAGRIFFFDERKTKKD